MVSIIQFVHNKCFNWIYILYHSCYVYERIDISGAGLILLIVMDDDIEIIIISHLTVNAPGMTAINFPRPANAVVQNSQQTHEMNIPNDLIGCIIGRGGQKINEIR